MARSIAESWARIKSWLQSNAPGVMDRLHPGATIEQIKALEATLRIRLPLAIVDSLQIHNGGDEAAIFPNTRTRSIDVTAFYPLSTDDIAREWNVWKALIDSGEFATRTSKPERGICAEWWSSSWIPITGNGGGDFQCADLAPGDGGMIGQIIGAWHDSPSRQMIAQSWSDYLQTIAEGLAGGKYVYDDEDGIIPAEDGW